MRSPNVAVIGAGPAGIYAADILLERHPGARVDLFERLPAPFGLVRYGVAPDHPRIKEIVKVLQRVMSRPQIRFFGNVDFGSDLKLAELRQFYDAVIVATGADADDHLEVPGVELPGSFGAAEFVSWYDGHPDVPRAWPLTARQVAVTGAGNVALDVARMLAKPVEEQLVTDIPANVEAGLRANRCTDVHVFARRGPAQVKFTPLELRELAHSPNVDVIVHPRGFEIDEASQRAITDNKSTRLVVDTLLKYLEAPSTGAAHRIHIHLCQAPIEILGETQVTGLRTERTVLMGDGTVRGTGELLDWPVQAVYRAVGYRSRALPGLPFDRIGGVLSHQAGRVLDLDGTQVPGVYATGWIKRGPTGLIGHTKSDAAETVASLLDDLPGLPAPDYANPHAILAYLRERRVEHTTWEDWLALDTFERHLGEATGRERIEVVDREDMIAARRPA